MKVDLKGILFSALSIAVVTAILATTFSRQNTAPDIMIPSLNFAAPAGYSTLAGDVINARGIPVNKYSFDQSNIGALVKRDQHNIVTCSLGTSSNVPLIANGTTAITSSSRYWGYEYTGNELANYRAGKTQLSLYDGTFFLSNGELNAAPDIVTRNLYDQINRLTSYDSSSRSKMFYFMSQNDLCFSCTKGLQDPRFCPGYAGYSSSSAISCTNGSQCPTGQGCVNGTCGTCVYTAQCPNGQACVNGTCGTCTNSNQCNAQVCSSGVCVPCDTTHSCPTGSTCTTNGICVSSSSSSSVSSSSSSSLSSISSSSSSACTNGTICPNGQVCTNGTCLPCDTTRICPGGRICSNGVCIPCDTNHTCPVGSTCQSNGACIPNSSSSSSSSSVVVSSTPSSSSSSSGCTGPLCPNNQICSNGICIPCDGTHTCPTGRTCSGGICVPVSSSSSSSSSSSIPSSSSSSSVPSSSSSSSSSLQCDGTHPCPSGKTCVGNICVPTVSSSSSSSICQNASSVCNPAAISQNCISAIFNYATCSCECTAFASSSSSSRPFVANTCGNGVLELRYNANPYGYYTTPVDEECDDGNNDDDDGCYANCTTMIPPTLLGTKVQVSCYPRSAEWSQYSVWFNRIDPKLPANLTSQGSIPVVGNSNMGLGGQALTFASPHPDDGGVEKIWLFGTSSGTSLYSNATYQYATSIYSSTDGFRWEYRSELPVAMRNDRNDTSVSVVKYRNPTRNADELWLFGGKTFNRSQALPAYTTDAKYSDKVFLSQDGINWTPGPALPYKVYNPRAAVLNDKIYVIAESIISKLPWNLSYAQPHNSRMVFSFNGTSWSIEPQLLPIPLNAPGLLGIGYLRLTSGPFTSPQKTNADYNLTNFNFVSFRNALYVIGGQTTVSWAGRTMYDVYRFDGTQWTHVSSVPGNTNNAATAIYQDRLWLLGSGTYGAVSSCDVYSTADGINWRQEVNFLPTARASASALTYKLGASNALWVLGGSTTERRVQVMQTNYVSTATGSVKTAPYCVGAYDYAEVRCDIGTVSCPAGYSPSCYPKPNEQRYFGGGGVSSARYSQTDGLYHDLDAAANMCTLASPVLASGDSSLLCTPANDVIMFPSGYYTINSDDYYSQTPDKPSSLPSVTKLSYANCNNCPDFSDSPSPRCLKNDDPSVSVPMTCGNLSSLSSSASSTASVPTLSGNLFWAEQGKINTIRLDGTGKKPFYIAPTYRNPSTGTSFYYKINAIAVDNIGRKVYWSMQNPDWVSGTTSGDYQIVVADINASGIASNIRILQQSATVIFTGLALDGSGNLYFARMPASGFTSTSRIQKYNLQTQQITEVVTISTTTPTPTGLAIDAQNSLLVWTKLREIYASDLAGQGAHQLLQRPTNIQNILSLDTINQRIYWYDIPSGTNNGTFHMTTYDGATTTDLLTCIKGSASVLPYTANGSLVWLSPYDGNTSTPGKILATGPDGTAFPAPIVTTGTADVVATSLALDVPLPTVSVLPTITSPVCVSTP